MEGVGLAASFITIAHLLWITLRYANRILRSLLFETREELTKLQNDVRAFGHSFAEIKDQAPVSSCLTLRDVNDRFQRLNGQLESLVHRKVLIRRTEYRVPLRLSLLLYYDKLKSLQNSFQALKGELEKVAQSLKSKTVVEVVIQDYREANHVIASTPQTIAKRLLSLSTAYRGSIVEATVLRPHSCTGVPASSHRSIVTQRDVVSTSLSNLQPVGLLEASQNFFPESYCCRSQVPNLVISALREETFTDFSNTNLYRVLYFRNARNWKYLDLSVEIPTSSVYWQFTRLSKHRHPWFNSVRSACIPTSLLKQMTESLDSVDDLRDDLRISFRVPDRDDHGLMLSNITTYKQHLTVDHSTERTEHAIISAIYHMGCPRIDEKEVVRLTSIELPDRFWASFDGCRVEEQLSTHRPPTPTFCYNIQLLHRLRNAPGFARLVGVAIDTSRNHVKSYLIKQPDTACEPLIHRASDPSLHHPWSQIEDWSRQLLQRIHAVHAVGGVVGTLRHQRPPIFVDAFNRVYLWSFDTRIAVSLTACPFYPPEFRYLTHWLKRAPGLIEESLVTPAYDVYQCGQLLWMLAAGWASHEKSALNFKEDFYKVPKSWIEGLWFGLDPLPRLSTEIPGWFQDIVDACCAEDPLTRPSCADLLTNFPSIDNNADIVPQLDMSPRPLDDVSTRICQMLTSGCERCGRLIIVTAYKCTLCAGGDFDVCSTCFEEGRHCYDKEHLLVELDTSGKMPSATRYHSSPDNNRKRNVYAI